MGRRRTPLQLAFGERVRTRRATLGLTQEGLAEVTGKHRTWIGAVERGEVNARLDNLAALAAGLGVDLGELLAGMPTPTPA